MKVEAPTPRPLDALDSQVALIKALESVYGEDLVLAMGSDGLLDALDRVPRGLTVAAREVARKLNQAATIVVTDRMLDVVLDNMRAVRFGEPLMPADLLFPAGYVVLPRAVNIGELEADDYVGTYPPRTAAFFDAGFWIPAGVTTTGALHGFDPGPSSGLMYAQSVSLTHADRYVREYDDNDPRTEVILARGIERLRSYGVTHAPVYSSGWSFDVSWDPAEREDTFVLTPAGEFERRFWLSFWRTMQQEIFAPVRLRRQDKRPAARLGMVPEVVVADLRRVKHRSAEEVLPTGEIVMWTHRWRVTGHTRTLNRGTTQEKTVWVREHVKGPENRPLIEKDRVYKLTR